MSAARLNITNGDCAVTTLTRAAQPGDWLPWRDGLHEGPVPAGLVLPDLSSVRARFIAERGWALPDRVQADFHDRDDQLARFGHYDRVRLWFEPDLYDQLQLLQLLDWFAGQATDTTALTLLCVDDDLGGANPETVQRFLDAESPVTAGQLTLAQRAWQAFRAPTPHAWAHLLSEDTTALPFLAGAVRRLLEEYPLPRTGLSRSAYHALCLVGQGEETFGTLFAEYQNTEERRFMGDLGFLSLLNLMTQGEHAVLTTDAATVPHIVDPVQRFTVTDRGRAVLAGRASAGDLMVRNRWIGGVELQSDHYWTWDVASDTLLEQVGIAEGVR